METIIPGTLLPSFPRKRESRTVLRQTRPLPAGYFWIPAYAGMTVGVRGNDCMRAARMIVGRPPPHIKTQRIRAAGRKGGRGYPLRRRVARDGRTGRG